MPRKVLIELRRDTAANWTAANPILAAGEPGWEFDTDKLKIGDGSTHWNSLSYFAAGSGVSSLDALTGAITLAAGANVTITDNSPSAGDIEISAASWSLLTNPDVPDLIFTNAGDVISVTS